MATKQYVDAPTPIMTVADAALAALAQDKRFKKCPNGTMEIGWRQPSKRADIGDRPARYSFTIEFLFDEAAL